MRRLGRIIRGIVTAASFLLLLVTIVAWCAGSSSWYRISLWREGLDDESFRLSEVRVDVGRGDFGLRYSPSRAGADEARARGCPPGVRWDPWFFDGKPTAVRPLFVPEAGPDRLREHRGWRWEHAGVVLGRRTWLDTLAGVWGGRVPNAVCVEYAVAAPYWMAVILFAAIPAQRGYTLIRRRRAGGADAKEAVERPV